MASEQPKSNKRNYYRILYVQPDAPMEVVQASYRTIMQKLKAHPDLGGDHWNASVINEAFETLSDPDKRRDYDKLLFKINTWKSLGRQTKSHRRRSIPSTPPGRTSSRSLLSNHSGASVDVFESHDVVFAEIISTLHFNDTYDFVRRVFDTMLGVLGNVKIIAWLVVASLFAAGEPCLSFDDNPMLRTLLM